MKINVCDSAMFEKNIASPIFRNNFNFPFPHSYSSLCWISYCSPSVYYINNINVLLITHAWEKSRNNATWPQRVGHERQHSFFIVLLVYLFLDTSHHALKKSRLQGCLWVFQPKGPAEVLVGSQDQPPDMGGSLGNNASPSHHLTVVTE